MRITVLVPRFFAPSDSSRSGGRERVLQIGIRVGPTCPVPCPNSVGVNKQLDALTFIGSSVRVTIDAATRRDIAVVQHAIAVAVQAVDKQLDIIEGNVKARSGARQSNPLDLGNRRNGKLGQVEYLALPDSRLQFV